jgi:hypothetical protein
MTVITGETAVPDTTLLLDSLRRRMRAMHSLYADALATMTLDHVNHFEREGVLPIAFSLFHYTNMQDVSFAVISGEPVLWDASWQMRVRMAIDDHGKERPVADMIHQRIGDYAAFGDYQRAVFGRTEAWLDRLDGEVLTRVIVARPLPPVVADTYSARVAGPEGITVLVSPAGSTSTASATWARSSWRADSSASAA